MTPTVHKNQVHCPGVAQLCVCSSLMSAALPVCRGKLPNVRADCSRTVARKFAIGGLCVFAGGFGFVREDLTLKLTKSRLIYSVSCFNLRGLKALLGELTPQKPLRGDGTGLFYCWSLLRDNNMATNLHVFTSRYGSRVC